MENTNVPNGLAKDIDAECNRYDNVISSLGGIDLQLLGIGHTGHIGFNEPDEDFDKTTHCVKLKQQTIDANARFFENAGEVPKYAITMIFVLLYTPCAAALTTIHREMGSLKWTAVAAVYPLITAWYLSAMFYQCAVLIQKFFT